MIDVLLRMLCGATLGLALVLLLRRPARRVFGAGPAFTLWPLPAVLMLAPLLPRQFVPTSMAVLPGLIVTPHVPGWAADRAGLNVDWALVLIGLWLAGAAICIARLAWHYARLRSGVRRGCATWLAVVKSAAPGLDVRRVRIHAAGPAVLWALPRSLILLPQDFAQRFGNATVRELVLRHELIHAHRGDAWWTLAMEIVCALLWFHPLAWFARPCFRLDQELACDAAALRTAPGRAATYARTLLDSAAVRPVPALIPWLSEPQLKERLAMISRIAPGTLRRRAGFVAIAALLAGGLLVAGAQTPVQASTQTLSPSKPPSVDITYKNRNPPHYPANAIKNDEQGTVMLRVRVDSIGSVTTVDVDPSKTTTSSAELRAAAVTAAEGWKFNPGEENGKPVGGWITIPVSFSLEGMGPCPEGQGHEGKPPFKCVALQPAARSS